MSIQDWVTTLPWDKIRKAAKLHSIQWDLLGAIVMTESAGVASATRYEPGYKWLYRHHEYANGLKISHLTEEVHQKISWGLCQLMGGRARELGFRDDLPKLIDPDINLYYGAKNLKGLIIKYDEERLVIASYNSGSPVYKKDKLTGVLINETYVDKVSRYLRDLREI